VSLKPADRLLGEQRNEEAASGGGAEEDRTSVAPAAVLATNRFIDAGGSMLDLMDRSEVSSMLLLDRLAFDDAVLFFDIFFFPAVLLLSFFKERLEDWDPRRSRFEEADRLLRRLEAGDAERESLLGAGDEEREDPPRRFPPPAVLNSLNPDSDIKLIAPIGVPVRTLLCTLLLYECNVVSLD
jgi:hypothetical protein